ncbi:putative polygalacturonate 4-alpha-galacturonosyltransferase [Dioscorea sansibarensis]
MKGYAGAVAPGKRRWRVPALLIFALVIVSLLLPLALLLGYLNHFPYGYLVDERSLSVSAFGSYGHLEGDSDGVAGKYNEGLDAFTDTREQFEQQEKNNVPQVQQKDVLLNSETKENSYHGQKDIIAQPKELHQPVAGVIPDAAPNVTNSNEAVMDNAASGLSNTENGKSCQLEFGSYCLWSLEHKEVMLDTLVKRLKDQVFMARAYYPSIAKLPRQDALSRELKQSIQDHEHILSEAIVDADLPPLVEQKIQRMDQVIEKAKSCSVDCHNIDKKLRQLVDLTEDEAHFHMEQSAFLYHLGVQTMPKSHHCLSMRLTVEYFKSLPVDLDQSHTQKIGDPLLRHHVIFSRSILAASVVINSTVMNSEETGRMVFHLLTDVQNYYSMKIWFARNSYREATIHVLNYDELDRSYTFDTPLSLPEEYRVSIRNNDQPPLQIRTEYLSVFGSSHFLLPEIFKHLKKVVVLDDDVVVQRDLSSLWNLDLEGKVIGAVEFCGVRLDQLKSYLRTNQYLGSSCAWMSGLNIVDLDKWREHNVSETYQSLLQKSSSMNEASRRAAALPISLLAFKDLIHPLDRSWAVSGLGHTYGVSKGTIENAATLHYNGNMKPWLELGIPNYKTHWRKYLTKDERFMDECNVSA